MTSIATTWGSTPGRTCPVLLVRRRTPAGSIRPLSRGEGTRSPRLGVSLALPALAGSGGGEDAAVTRTCPAQSPSARTSSSWMVTASSATTWCRSSSRMTRAASFTLVISRGALARDVLRRHGRPTGDIASRGLYQHLLNFGLRPATMSFVSILTVNARSPDSAVATR
jgi:hypothetical protein